MNLRGQAKSHRPVTNSGIARPAERATRRGGRDFRHGRLVVTRRLHRPDRDPGVSRVDPESIASRCARACATPTRRAGGGARRSPSSRALRQCASSRRRRAVRRARTPGPGRPRPSHRRAPPPAEPHWVAAVRSATAPARGTSPAARRERRSETTGRLDLDQTEPSAVGEADAGEHRRKVLAVR